MLFVKDVAKNFALSLCATLGMFTAISVWNAGLGDKIEESASKLFNKKGS